MTNEANWDKILTRNHRRLKQNVTQKDNLENHAKQLTRFLDSETVASCSAECEESSQPGLKLHLTFPDRQKPARSSMKKLPRKASSFREKKKNSDNSDKKSARKTTSFSESDAKVTAVQKDRGKKKGEETGPKVVTCVATYEERPIMTSLNAADLILVSADKGDLATLQVLVDKPCDYLLCVTKDEKGESPLHKTAKGGYLKCMKYLADKVSDEVSCADSSGLTPAAHAAKNGHVNCLKWLIEETSAYVELAVTDGQSSLLHHAARHGMEQCLTYLLAFMAKRKITTDVIDEKGQTPVHSAAQMGHLSCVQTLIENGADVLAKDTEGLTSANVAYLHKHSLCSRYLIMAESCWILSSRVSTLFREVNKYKRENKDLKKSVESLKSSKNSDLPNRPETVGGHTNDISNISYDYLKRDTEQTPIGPRNFPDGESPKSTFTEADKQRPPMFTQQKHVVNRDAEVNDVKHFQVVRQSSFQIDGHVIPTVSTTGIGEIPPAEKIKAKEIAMVTHQLMSTRHLEVVQSKKTKNAEIEDKKCTVDDSVVEVIRRTSVSRSREFRPKSLCDNDMLFLRSATDIDFARKLKKKSVLERRASCTEIQNLEDNGPKESIAKEKSFWDKVGAKKLLSRKKSLKTPSAGSGNSLSDLQTVSTDKILELYARESRGSSTRLNSPDSPMGQRSASTSDVKSPNHTRDGIIHASFREPRARFQPMVPARMSERFTPSTCSVKVIQTRESSLSNAGEKKVRPVAKPRQKLRKSSSSSSESSLGSKDIAQNTAQNDNKTPKIDSVPEVDNSRTLTHKSRDEASWSGLKGTGTELVTADQELECTDV